MALHQLGMTGNLNVYGHSFHSMQRQCHSSAVWGMERQSSVRAPMRGLPPAALPVSQRRQASCCSGAGEPLRSVVLLRCAGAARARAGEHHAQLHAGAVGDGGRRHRVSRGGARPPPLAAGLPAHRLPCLHRRLPLTWSPEGRGRRLHRDDSGCRQSLLGCQQLLQALLCMPLHAAHDDTLPDQRWAAGQAGLYKYSYMIGCIYTRSGSV